MAEQLTNFNEYLNLTDDEIKLFNLLYFRRSFGVPRILKIYCFSHLSQHKLYTYIHSFNNNYSPSISKNAKLVIELKQNPSLSYNDIAKLTGLSIKTVYNYAMLDMEDLK